MFFDVITHVWNLSTYNEVYISFSTFYLLECFQGFNKGIVALFTTKVTKVSNFSAQNIIPYGVRNFEWTLMP